LNLEENILIKEYIGSRNPATFIVFTEYKKVRNKVQKLTWVKLREEQNEVARSSTVYK